MRSHSTLQRRSQRRLREALLRSDANIEAEIYSCVISKVLGGNPDDISVSVSAGVARMIGVVAERREAVRLERLASKVPGVSRVESSVTWEADTTYPGRRPRFAYFAKSQDRTGGRPTSSPPADHCDPLLRDGANYNGKAV